jgi:dihydroorotate dehydrogenase electron transfer subunit
MAAIWNGEARVVRQTRYSPGCWKVTLAVPSAEPIAAGQFCHVLTDFATDPLLRRPFSYWDVTSGAGGATHVDLLYTVVGRGTDLLARKKPRSRVGYLGPLGIGFTPKPVETVVYVAGGVGIVPFYIFTKQLFAGGFKPRVILLFGGRTASMLYGIDDFPALGVEVHAATEDGSRGRKGLVTALLEDWLPRLGRSSLQLYTCGPERMMDAVVRIARREGLPCEVSMEKRMGCALGACGACVTRVLADDGCDWRYSRICIEGPTYDAARLVIE